MMTKIEVFGAACYIFILLSDFNTLELQYNGTKDLLCVKFLILFGSG